MGFYDGPSIVTNGLLLSLDAADKNSYPGSGTVWNDLTNSGNNGSLVSTPTFSNTNGGNLIFNGTNQYVTFTDSGLLPTAGLTVSAWCKTTVADKWIIDKSAGGVTNGYFFAGTTIGGISMYINSINLTNPGGVLITNGNWMLLTGVWTPSTSIIIYQNETQLGITTTSIPASINNPSANLRVAGRTTNIDFWNGSLGSVSIYNRALSANEVSQNYNAQKSRFGL